MSELKLLVVSETLGRGGAEQALVNLLPVLRQRGCECEVAALYPPYPLAADLEETGVPVHRLDLSHRWNVAQGVPRLLRLLHAGKFDVLHGHLFFSRLYIALTRPFSPDPYRVVTFHNLDFDIYPADTAWRKIRKRLDAWLMKNWIDGRVAVSTAVARHYESHLGLSGVHVIPNAFAMNRLNADPVLDRKKLLGEYGLSEHDFVVLFCGRLVKQKGHRFFIQALDILRRRGSCPKALVLGDGPLAAEIAADIRARKLTEQVQLGPAVTHSQLLRVMQATDLFVIASTQEGFPLSPGEAMALGRPVLATRVGGIPDLLDDGVSGLLVPPADPLALAEGMARLMDDREERQCLGREGRRRMEQHFSAENLAAVWMEYYRAGIHGRYAERRSFER